MKLPNYQQIVENWHKNSPDDREQLVSALNYAAMTGGEWEREPQRKWCNKCGFQPCDCFKVSQTAIQAVIWHAERYKEQPTTENLIYLNQAWDTFRAQEKL